MCEFYLRRRLSGSGGLGDLDVLHLNRVLAVAVGVLQLADIHCLVLGVWRGRLCKQEHILLVDSFSITRLIVSHARTHTRDTATFLILDSNDRK